MAAERRLDGKSCCAARTRPWSAEDIALRGRLADTLAEAEEVRLILWDVDGTLVGGAGPGWRRAADRSTGRRRGSSATRLSTPGADRVVDDLGDTDAVLGIRRAGS